MPSSRRVLAIACAALAAGEMLGVVGGAAYAWWPLAAVFAVLTFLIAAGWGRRIWYVPAVFLLGLALAWRADGVRRAALTDASMTPGPFVADLVVRGEPRVSDGGEWTRFPSAFAGGALTVVMPGGTNALPQVGETWRCAGWLDRRDLADLRPRHLWVRGAGTHAERVRSAAGSWRGFFARLRRDFSHRAGIGLPEDGEEASLNRAILLGERAAMDFETRQSFVNAGTVHLFAISGLHVMIVYWVFLVALTFAGVPLRASAFVLVPLLWGYVATIGFPPSAVRAGAMASVHAAAPLLLRRSDLLAAWEATFLGFALVDPLGFLSVGSMLSFAVMLGIVVFIRWAEPFRSRLLGFVGVPLAAWAAGMPIVAHYFGQIAPGGILANFILVPIASVSVVSGVCGIAASYVSETLAAHLNNLAGLVTEAMRAVSWGVSRLPGASLKVEAWPVWCVFAWYAALALALWLIRRVWTRCRSRI